MAYWDNLVAPYLQLSLRPEKRIELVGEAYFMRAPEDMRTIVVPGDDPAAGGVPAGPFTDGGERGLLTRVWLKWRATGHLTGHLLWERFDPGDFYWNERDTAHFLRWEIIFTY